jgi:hypothetical protein
MREHVAMSKSTLTALLVILASLAGIAGMGVLSLVLTQNCLLFVFVVGFGVLFSGVLVTTYFKDKPKTKRRIHEACKIIGSIGIINFALFFVIALLIGGDALNGKVEAGHYYLGNHGKYTEVSFIVYAYSTFHTVSLFFTHPLAMIAGLIYFITGGKYYWLGNLK